MPETILVIGATGNVGSALVPRLAAHGPTVRAATRTPETYTTPHPNVQVVHFDYDDPSTYAPAVAGTDRLFLISKNADPEPQQTVIPLLDTAREAGTRHAVLMTAMGVDASDEIPLRQVEKHLIGSGMAYTILRPNWFMQNFTTGFIRPQLDDGDAFYVPAGEAKSSQIDTRDVGAVAARVLTSDDHAGREYALTGPEAFSYGEAAAVLSDVSGRDISYVPIPDEALRQALSEAGWHPGQVELMVNLFQGVRAGYTAAVTPDVENVLWRPPTPFEHFARDHADVWR